MACASLVSGAMASLAVKLNSILMPKYELMAGARADVLFLRAELESMHAFLERLSAVRDRDAQVKAWTKVVRELAYDTEDAIDEFMRRVDASHGAATPNHGSGTLLGLASRAKRLVSTAWTRLCLANELKGLKARAIEVSERRSRYKYGEDMWGSGDHMVADPRINVLYADVPDLIGIDGPMSDIMEWLMGEATTLKVLSIVGFGGLGKTTLAMEVFRRVGGQFSCRAFTAVSQKLDMKKLLKDLLSQVAQGEADGMDTWEEGQLIRKLRECLLNRR
ncbi:unnamed protein product [Urochloa humidicola]